MHGCDLIRGQEGFYSHVAMKLDASCLRYLSKDDLRVLTAVEVSRPK